MKKPIAYGIDFGTTNTSMSIIYDDGQVDPVNIDKVFDIDRGSKMPYSMPSLVYLDRNRNRLAGRLAIKQFLRTGSNNTNCGKCSLVKRNKMGVFTDCKQYKGGSGCQNSRLISGLKNFLSSCQNVPTHSWAENFDLEDLVAVLLRALKTQADQFTGSEVERVVIGHPVVFVGARGDYKKQKCALMNLKEAATRVGFKEINFLSEPDAVLLDENLNEGYSLAVDFGGGTYDVSVLKIEKGKRKAVASEGETVGGEMFEALIFDNALADIVEITRLPKGIAKKMRTLAGVAELLRNPNLPVLVGNGTDIIKEILFGGQAYNFYKAIEDAKIELSKNSVANIEFHRPGIKISQEIYRNDFESWISPSLSKIDRATRKVLNKAGIKPNQIHTVLRTGGSSQIPQFITRLEKMLPKAEIRKRPVFTAVAYGLGIHARDKWVITDDKKQILRIQEDGIRYPETSDPPKPTGSKKNFPAPELSESSGGDGRYTTPPPPKAPSASEPPEPFLKQSKDEYARAMALYKAEEEWKHKMGDFDRLPDDGGRNRAYESKCVKCDKRAIAKVQYPANYSDAQGVPGWHGNATEGPCSPELRRNSTTKAEIQAPTPKEVITPDSFEVPKPSRDDILDNLAREKARRAARDKRHRVNAMFLVAYPGARIHKGRCERCGRRVFGKIQKFTEDTEESERISVYGEALKYRCSKSGAKR